MDPLAPAHRFTRTVARYRIYPALPDNTKESIMGARNIARRARSIGRGRVGLYAVALAAGCYAASGCMGQPGQGPVDAAPVDAAPGDAAPASPDAAPAPARFVQVAYAHASNFDPYDKFGFSVAVAGDMIVAGAPGEASAATGIDGDQDDDSALYSGAAYAFRRGDAGWQQEAYIKPTVSRFEPGDPSSGEAGFGANVVLSGDTLAVAAPDDRSQGGRQDGAVYVFRRGDTGWHHEAFLHDFPAHMFGWSVALDGDTLAVFAPCEVVIEDPSILAAASGTLADDASGCPTIYVFQRNGTIWSEEARIRYPDRQNPGGWYQDQFGDQMVLSGDTLVVSASHDDSGAMLSGAVHVFRRSSTGWQREAYVKASNPGAQDYFGEHLALSGDTLVVGAPGEDSGATGIDGDQHDNSAPGSGAVYVFRRSGTEWQQEAYVKASISMEDDSFGRRVALSGDSLAVTSRANGLDHRGQGAVYMFRRGDTSWQEEPYPVIASERHYGSAFHEIALDGDTLVVGAHLDRLEHPDGVLLEVGGVYVFERVRD